MILFNPNIFEYKVRKRENLNFKVAKKSCEVLKDPFFPKIGLMNNEGRKYCRMLPPWSILQYF